MRKPCNDQTDDRVRPGFVILLLAMVAVIAVSLWHFLRGSPSASDAPGSAPETRPAPVSIAKTKHLVRRIPPDTASTPELVDTAEATPVPLTEMGRQWGVEFTGVTVSTNWVVTVGYTIVSAEKAAAIMDGVSSYLLEPASGVKIALANPVPEGAAVPAHSRARSAALSMWHAGGSFPPPPSRAVTGRAYSILLPNLTGVIKPGGKVIVVVGTLQTEITVQAPPIL